MIGFLKLFNWRKKVREKATDEVIFVALLTLFSVIAYIWWKNGFLNQ